MDNNQRFEILSELATSTKKFNLSKRQIVFKLKPIPENENPFEWVSAGIDNVVSYIISNLQPDDQIGMTFSCDSFKEKLPGYLSFRAVSSLKTTDVWAIISAIFQSNSSGLNTDTFKISVTIVAIPRGRGRRKLKYNCFEEECSKRRGIIQIRNDDHLCFVRALVVAIAYSGQNINRADIRRNKEKIQDQEAIKLMTEAGITIPNEGVGFNEITLFQQFLQSKFKIIVYEYGYKGRNIMFEGVYSSLPKLNILHYKGHYNVITSLTAAFACSYFCDECHTPYNEKRLHRCSKTCPCCQTESNCNEIQDKIKCDNCKRLFRGPTCYDKHLISGTKIGSRSLCEKIQYCEKCFTTFQVANTNRVHICGEKFCKICGGYRQFPHYCYMKQYRMQPNVKDFSFVFYDFETQQEKPVADKLGATLHEPNLCVAHTACDKCVDDMTLQFCNKCGFKQTIFNKENVVEEFMTYLLSIRKKVKTVVCVAHNAQSFYAQFILSYILEETNLTPNLIMRGTKIILMQFENIRFIDSLNYFPMALNKLPKALDLGPELKKGYFPHLFNTKDNAGYIGKLPDVGFFNPDGMNSTERDVFLQWYENRKSEVFNFNQELIQYCISDVDTLKRACLKFRNIFLSECKVCPFTEGVTIASVCNLMFRRNFLMENTIGIIPRNGYRMSDNQSAIAIVWLTQEEKRCNLQIQHAGNQKEIIVAGYKVDGFCPKTKQVYEFYGCFYHGHPDCYLYNRDRPIYKRNITDTMNSRYESTLRKAACIRAAGFNLVEMWECEFKKLPLHDESLSAITPLVPRDSFYGGRTGNTKTYYKIAYGEKIKYIDICSLYPYICKYGKFPVGHPTKILIGDECNDVNLDSLEGLIKCTVLPPRELYHPVLPTKMHNKLMFVLCRTCALLQNLNSCNHDENERAMHGSR